MKLSHSKILLLGILPRGDHTEYKARIKNINSIIKTYANEDTIQFLDIGPQFEAETTHDHYDGDKIHVNYFGYKIWAETMDPLFQKVLIGMYHMKMV